MTANFGTCSSGVTKSFTLLNKPQPAFTASGNLVSCNIPATIQFNNTSTGAASYRWDFGDSTFSTDVNPSHTYTRAGFYTVSLIAINSNGCNDTLSKTDFIKLGPPKIISFENLPLAGCTPKNVHRLFPVCEK